MHTRNLDRWRRAAPRPSARPAAPPFSPAGCPPPMASRISCCSAPAPEWPANARVGAPPSEQWRDTNRQILPRYGR